MSICQIFQTIYHIFSSFLTAYVFQTSGWKHFEDYMIAETSGQYLGIAMGSQ